MNVPLIKLKKPVRTRFERILNHWMTYLPKMVMQMEKDGVLYDNINQIGDSLHEQLWDLIDNHGMTHWQADEILRDQWQFTDEAEDEDA